MFFASWYQRRLIDVYKIAIALLGSIPACSVYQDSSHGLGSHSVKVGSILPSHSLVIHQSKINLIHQVYGLECMTESFAAHITVGHAAKLFIHQQHQLVEG